MSDGEFGENGGNTPEERNFFYLGWPWLPHQEVYREGMGGAFTAAHRPFGVVALSRELL